MTRLLTLACAVLFAAPTFAQATLDATFSGDGIAVVDLGGPGVADEAIAIGALRGPNRIVVAARVRNASGDDVAVCRLTDSGDLDPTYGVGGVRLIDVGGIYDSGIGADIQGDGSVWFATVAGQTDRRVVVGHVLADGTMDPAFGTAGVATLDAGPGFEEIDAVAYDGLSFTVSAGGGIGGRFLVARFTATGQPDAGFGTGGILLGPAGPPAQRILALDAERFSAGRLGVTGIQSTPDGRTTTFVGRLLASGAPNPLFSGDGFETVTFLGTGVEYGTDVRLYDSAPGFDQTLVVAQVSTADYADGRVALARFTQAGAPDPSWGAGGVVALDFAGTADLSTSVTLGFNNTLLVAGRAYPSPGQPGDAAVYRLSAAGVPDPSWGPGGRVLIDVPSTTGAPSDDRAVALSGDTSQRTILAGSTTAAGASDVLVVRFRATPVAAEDAPGAAGLALSIGPNPAGRAATLRLALAEAATVRVSVADALGRTVLRLDRALAAGSHALPLDVSGLAPGVYVARVAAAGGGAAAASSVRFTIAR